jgi:hypothetical protein
MPIFDLCPNNYCFVAAGTMDVIASGAKQSLLFRNEIAAACKAGLAMTTSQIACDRALWRLFTRIIYRQSYIAK